MRAVRGYVLAFAALAAWACAKANEAVPDDGSYDPTGRGGTGARGGVGGKATGGTSTTGGSATGGSSTGGSSTGGSFTGGSSSGGSGALAGGASGQSGASAGRSASGGVSGAGARAGRGAGGNASAVGGATSTGGTPSSGGRTGAGSTGGTPSSGGMSATGGLGGMSATGGTPGTGMVPAGALTDALAKADLVLYYKATGSQTMSDNVNMSLYFRNQTDSPIDLKTVTVRYWMSSEPAPDIRQSPYVAAALKLKGGAPTFVGNGGNSYLEFAFTSGTVPLANPDNPQNDLSLTEFQALVQKLMGSKFNQSNDWSFDATASSTSKPNYKVTVYRAGTLIWGCDPWLNCADFGATGEGGAGGQGG